MSFVYRAPLKFIVPAKFQGKNQTFASSVSSILVKYIESADCPPLADDKGVVAIVAVWGRDGRTKLDRRLWSVKRIRDLGKSKNGENIVLLEVSFSGGDLLTKRIRGELPDASSEARALCDAFLEQDLIQIVIDAGPGIDKDGKPVDSQSRSQATLILEPCCIDLS